MLGWCSLLDQASWRGHRVPPEEAAHILTCTVAPSVLHLIEPVESLCDTSRLQSVLLQDSEACLSLTQGAA